MSVVTTAPMPIMSTTGVAAISFPEYTQAQFSAVPFRMPRSVIESIPFTEAPNPNAGDFDRAFWMDSEAHLWMMTVDRGDPLTTLRNAREAAASAVLDRVGIMTVPVYYTTVNGVTGALRPLVATGGVLSTDVHRYTDSILTDVLRLHVAAQVIELPEPSPFDVLQTLDGRAIPVSLSGAFNGGTARDTARFGLPRPAWDAVCEELARRFEGWTFEDVMAATVEAFSAVPVTDWVQTLRPLSDVDPDVDYVHDLMTRVLALGSDTA